MIGNPFPESDQKKYLRNYHLINTIRPINSRSGPVNYLGLPSAEMRDVRYWKECLGEIVAIENDRSVVEQMYRTAAIHKIRDRICVIEKDLKDVFYLLALEDAEFERSMANLSKAYKNKLKKARNIKCNVVNLDFCGGFLYPNSEGTNSHSESIQLLLKYQARQKITFVLMVTFQARDTGAADYDKFILSVLSNLEKHNIDVDAMREYYLSDNIDGHPRQLRRLRFCVPIFLVKEALENYQVIGLGAWYYKTFYHALFRFVYRPSESSLGYAWPPIDDIKNILNVSLKKIDVLGDKVVTNSLEAPEM